LGIGLTHSSFALKIFMGPPLAVTKECVKQNHGGKPITAPASHGDTVQRLLNPHFWKPRVVQRFMNYGADHVLYVIMRCNAD